MVTVKRVECGERAPQTWGVEEPAAANGLGQCAATVAVVIPSLTVTERLVACLEALASQTTIPAEAVVVLSRATPTDLERMQGRWTRTQFLRCSGPRSFCRAVNAGIASTRTPWVLVLNDDVVLAPEFLERLFDSMPSDERIGMVCGKLLSQDGRRIDSTGQFVSCARTAVERGHGSRRLDRFNAPGWVFSVPAAAALYRREMLDAVAVGGQCFDERFGMYLEDLDLGWRAQRAGWSAYYVPDAVARHVRGATAKTRVARSPWLRRYYLPHLAPTLQARYVLNRYRLIAKHDTLGRCLLNLPWLAWYEARLWAYLCLCDRHTIRLIRRALSRVSG